MTTICAFPTELFSFILCYSDPRDIVRWRTVSKGFCAMIQSDLLWKTLYTNTSIPRPPGPSHSQPKALLERMLVKSARLVDTWPTRDIREVASVNISLGLPRVSTTPKLIAGRWIVGCEDARRIMLHDADPRAGTPACKLLWEEVGPTVSAWDVHSVSPSVGESVVYVLLELCNDRTFLIKWKLLEFRLNDVSGEIYDSTAIEPLAWARSILSRVELHGGKSRFLFIPTQNPQGVVFDTQTRTFYKVPAYRVALQETFPQHLRGSPRIDFQMEFTDTHIISLYRHHDSLYRFMTLIQIFAIPSDRDSVQESVPALRLTHEGFLDEHLLNVNIMDPRVDPITGDTHIRLLDHFTCGEDPKILIVDLTIPKSSNSNVTRMIFNDVHRIHILKEGVKKDYYQSRQYLDLCDGKMIRGFFRAKRRKQALWENVEYHIMKFTIDTERDPWAVECGQLMPAYWRVTADGMVGKPGRCIAFDGLRGLLCYPHPITEHDVVVVEIE